MRFVWALVLVAASSTVTFVIGKNKGINEGYSSASDDYKLWSIGMLYRDPAVRRDAIMLVPDGARVQVPKCDADEALSAIAWRRPEQGYKGGASLKLDGDAVVVSVPHNGDSKQPEAAVVVGCEKKMERQKIRDLTKSWEFPSNLR